MMRVILGSDGLYTEKLRQLLDIVGIGLSNTVSSELLNGCGTITCRDIVLLDLRRYPRQTIDLIRTIRQRQGFGPGIIVMAKRGDIGNTLEALEAGADSLTHYPGTDASLIAASIIGLGRLMGVLPTGMRGHGTGRQTETGCGAQA